jgi:hypothetical protein
VNQISGTTTTDAPAQTPDAPTAADTESAQLGGAAGAAPADAATQATGFQSRGRARRRGRFLRKARELAYRDLGGLVFNLHRFGQRNDALVLAKLTTLGHIDAELRAIEDALQERQPLTVLREAGITACPRCAAIHSSEDSFCPNCGLSMARHVDLPIAGAVAATPASVAQPIQASPSSPPAQPTPPAQSPAPTTAQPIPATRTAAPGAAMPTAPGQPSPPAQRPSPPTPPRAPASQGAPINPFAAPPGRSPAPPAAPGGGSQPLPAPVSAPVGIEDAPTEITRPPTSGS